MTLLIGEKRSCAPGRGPGSSAPATLAQLQPLSSSTMAFARRATRCSASPSRASPISARRSASDKKPPRIIYPSRIDPDPLVKQLSGSHKSE